MRTIIIGATLIVGIAVLTFEGVYLYRFYTESGTSTQQTSAEEESPDGNSPATAETVFVHRATPENISANSTYIDNPATNDNPEAILFITQNWNPDSSVGTYNDHPVGVWYDDDRQRWAIFNQDQANMTENASFNVRVSEKT